ncbi:hypothetical protein N325_08571, partial [Colius striatus]
QWPLKGERLHQANLLVQEQLQLGHIKPSTSPWNTPIFVIPKKSGKFGLLHDLRAINDQMQDTGALQPGMPNSAMLPENWAILIIDLKDCFFSIALHPDDHKRFAFTIPAVNRESPAQRYEWTVLPQGMKNRMKNSPKICQLYVDNALRPIRHKWPHALVYHYMDDILIAQEEAFTADQERDLETVDQERDLETILQTQGLTIAPEKVQRRPAWQYLGWSITEAHIRPQKLHIHTKIKTVNDAQKLMGDLQWLRPIVGITNDTLEPLRPLLKG